MCGGAEDTNTKTWQAGIVLSDGTVLYLDFGGSYTNPYT